MNRRNVLWSVLGGIAGALGMTSVVKASTKEPDGTKGFIVYYVNVGCAPLLKAEKYCEKLVGRFKKQRVEEKAFEGWGIVVVPVRPPQQTHVEFHAINGNTIKPLVIRKRNDLLVEDTPELRKNTKDYVLLMLGAPVDLDDVMFDAVCDGVFIAMQRAYNLNSDRYVSYSNSPACFQDGVLANCMMNLGRVRMKSVHPVAVEEAETLMVNGIARMDVWRDKLVTD